MRWFPRLALVCLAAIGVAACDSEGTTRPAPTTVHFFNAAPNHERLSFFRERRQENERMPSAFLQSSQYTFDSGQYDFSVVTSAGTVTIESFSATLSPDLEYWFITTSPSGGLETVIASRPASFESTANARLSVVHADPSLGAVDVYLVAPGTPPVAGAAQDSIGYGQHTAPIEPAAGSYQFIFTTAGDPSDILYRSVEVDVSAGNQAFIAIVNGAGIASPGFVVTDIQGAATSIADATQAAKVRVVQSVNDRLDRDVLLDGGAPLFSALPFGVVPSHADVAHGVHDLDLTPVGNPGSIEATAEVSAFGGRWYTSIFAGDASTGINGATVIEDRRSIVGQATVRLMHAAALFPSIAIYIAPPGTAISAIPPAAEFLGTPAFSSRIGLRPGNYELTVVNVATSAVLAGPVPITLTAGGVYTGVTFNAAGGSTIDVNFFDDAPAP